jgi:hypothetical protein
MANIIEADFAAEMMGSTFPPIPARQNIFPTPSLLSLLAARSEISPTSAAPEHANINFDAAPHAEAFLSSVMTLSPFVYFIFASMKLEAISLAVFGSGNNIDISAWD